VQEELDVAVRDMVFVGQLGTNYLIHQYKSFIGSNIEINIEWEGKSTLAPDDSTAYLQIYNEVTSAWETIDYVANAKYSNFELSAYILDASSYKDASNVISVRIYQNASTSSILYTDYYGVLYPIQYGDSYTDKGTSYSDTYSAQGNSFTDQYEAKGNTFIDSLTSQGNTFTDSFSDRDTEYVRNYPPNVTEKILNK